MKSAFGETQGHVPVRSENKLEFTPTSDVGVQDARRQIPQGGRAEAKTSARTFPIYIPLAEQLRQWFAKPPKRVQLSLGTPTFALTLRLGKPSQTAHLRSSALISEQQAMVFPLVPISDD